MRSTRRVRTHCDAIHAATRFTRSVLNQSTARDDAPNVNKLSATIRKDESPEGERKLDGSLGALGLEDGNGLWTMNIPRAV